jgi:ureidoglycolate hydrolase
VSDQGSTTYPRLEISGLTKDSYTLFEGVIDTFSATSQALNGGLTTQFAHWSKPYPSRTYNQNEFTSIVDAIVDTVYWGRATP